ncbi:MAG: 50S ribosomal protein L15 [Alphaproteobacteria bacterium]|nr:50S ribosomal protein L15 [Alphaproteobacteria bacterium]MCL2757986.1 50S ribosomal protein L15 [Alphaproteobacteria bacterium]
MKLNALMDNFGARKKIKRVGRGMASGYGKTAGRGHKGQKARSGAKQQATFEGGQTPFYRRLPKIGFRNIFAKKYATINLGEIQKFVDAERIDAKKEISMESLFADKILNRKFDGLKILSKGEIKTAVNIVATKWSKAAEAAVTKAGGTIKSK